MTAKQLTGARAATGVEMRRIVRSGDPFDDEDDYEDDPDACPRCGGSGKVTTEDFESYFGAMYKPCPVCGGDPCIGEPPLS